MEEKINNININLQLKSSLLSNLKNYINDSICKNKEDDNMKLNELSKEQTELNSKINEIKHNIFVKNAHFKNHTIRNKFQELDSLKEQLSNKKSICLENKSKLISLQYELQKKKEKNLKFKEESDIAYNSNLDKLNYYKSLEIKNKELIQAIENEKQRHVNLEKCKKLYVEHIKFLHNELLENKGNIRVFCRVRPYLPKESLFIQKVLENTVDSKEEDEFLNNKKLKKNKLNLLFNNTNSIKELKPLLETKYIEYISNDKLCINGPIVKNHIGKEKTKQTKDTYNFDRVFQPSATQTEIFQEISQLVQSALDGYKVCIFAYGQTGSGKTFTMEGSYNYNIQENEKNFNNVIANLKSQDTRGIIPRSIEKIFEVKTQMEKIGWEFLLSISFFEIYLDQINDLLKNYSGNNNNNINNNNNNSNAYVSQYNMKDIITIDVNNILETIKILNFATNKRTKASTSCNEKSSRSHSICQLKINMTHKELNQTRDGTLNLIDLAGCEKLSASNVEGDNIKEAIAINKSLLCLKNVITSLTNNSNLSNKYVPFRDSTLTYVLQNYLGGDSKTLMFVNISPLITQINETNNSLKFATEVNSCQTSTVLNK